MLIINDADRIYTGRDTFLYLFVEEIEKVGLRVIDETKRNIFIFQRIL